MDYVGHFVHRTHYDIITLALQNIESVVQAGINLLLISDLIIKVKKWTPLAFYR